MGAVVTLSQARADGHAARGGSPEEEEAVDGVCDRRAAAGAAARDWLATQARVVELWRDLLADAGESGELVEALDAHAAFLNAVAARG